MLLNLGLKFDHDAAGHTFRVEAKAVNDSGGVQGWDLAGTIAVVPQGIGRNER
ncbi:MAG TPA: hypothetical protein VFL90_18630 [Methylomirabilota bacterium]|nr:hypothetical protein [Methylomirabilota bacterium]